MSGEIRKNDSKKFNYYATDKISAKIYEVILNAILTGKFDAGESLYINELAEKLDVSTTPVREALSDLESAGILKKRPYKSYKIKDFSFNEVKEIFETRIALESYSCKLASKRIVEENKERLKKIHEEGKQHFKNNNLNKFSNYNKTFHNILVKAADNKNLLQMYKKIQIQITLFAVQIFDITDRPEQTIKEHTELIEYILAGDGNEAARLMEQHILNSLAKYKTILGSS